MKELSLSQQYAVIALDGQESLHLLYQRVR